MLLLQWQGCFCVDLQESTQKQSILSLFSFRPDMPWHAVWLPFGLGVCERECVCVCLCVCVTSVRGVCLQNVRLAQQDEHSQGFSWKYFSLSVGLPLFPMCHFFCFLSTFTTSPSCFFSQNTHTLWDLRLVTVFFREALVTERVICVHYAGCQHMHKFVRVLVI